MKTDKVNRSTPGSVGMGSVGRKRRSAPTGVLLRDFMSQYVRYRLETRELIRKALEKPVTQASLALVGTLGLIVLLGVLALRPTLLTISELVREIKDEQQLVEALERKISALQTAQRTLGELEGRLYLLDDAVPTDFDVEVLMKELELLAIDEGLRMIGITQEGFLLRLQGVTKDQPAEVATLPIALSVGGSEESIRSFIAKLERFDRLMVINSLVVSSVSESGRLDANYSVRAVIGAEVYYQRS